MAAVTMHSKLPESPKGQNSEIITDYRPLSKEAIAAREGVFRLEGTTPKEEWAKLRDGFDAAMQPHADRAAEELLQKPPERAEIKGTEVFWMTPNGVDPAEKRVIIYLHGGAYTLGNAKALAHIPIPFASELGCQALAINYPLAPEKTFPAAPNAVVAVYKELIEQGYKPAKISFLGDSAGGGLVMGSILKARDEGLPLPASAILLYPWLDMEQKTATYRNPERIAATKVLTPEKLASARDAMCTPQDFSNPYLSPLNGDYSSGFCPTAIYAQGFDLLAEEGKELSELLSEAGVVSEYSCRNGGFHGLHEHYPLPEALETAKNAADFVRAHSH